MLPDRNMRSLSWPGSQGRTPNVRTGFRRSAISTKRYGRNADWRHLTEAAMKSSLRPCSYYLGTTVEFHRMGRELRRACVARNETTHDSPLEDIVLLPVHFRFFAYSCVRSNKCSKRPDH